MHATLGDEPRMQRRGGVLVLFIFQQALHQHVARAQKAAATLAEECGYVVVVGEEGHPEVEGLVARCV